MELILIGQPNCGKSTIFNEVAGYKSVSSNFPGITISYTSGEIDIADQKIKITDLPGTYSLQTTDDAERATLDYLLNSGPDMVIVNIIDSSVLSRSLELTLQLMELQKPMVVALNMMDEAAKKKIDFDVNRLSSILGISVIPTIGKKGDGVPEVFNQAYSAGQNNTKPRVTKTTPEIEQFHNKLSGLLRDCSLPMNLNTRFIAYKMLEKDQDIQERLKQHLDQGNYERICNEITKLEKHGSKRSELLVSSFRHNLAFDIFEQVARVGQTSKKDYRNLIDSLFMHPLFGYLFMALILFMTFTFIFGLAGFLEPFITRFFDQIQTALIMQLPGTSILSFIVKGFISGFSGGLSIVIPYLVPFFIVLALLEDTGYLARIAYLTDNLMHKIGLHGLSIVPMVLGYGCTVPAIMATRILKSPRDRLITATLTTLIPCSARMVIILGLVGALFSLKAAIIIYIINIVIIGIVGKIMARAMPEVSPGLIMEMPKYHLPVIKAVIGKTWLRLKDFIIIAWPLLIAGSIILELVRFFKMTSTINSVLAPFTSGILGLPAAVGIVLLFGILRKELALLLLATALGASNTLEIITLLSPGQIYTFTIFAVFYIPCLATIAALSREFNWKKAGLITLLTFLIAVFLAVLTRFIT